MSVCTDVPARSVVLLDTIQPYPTLSEAIFNALRVLESALA
jgi:hypothetical protein